MPRGLLFVLLIAAILAPTARDARADRTQGVTDFDLLPTYGQTGWAGNHRGSRNSNNVPFVAPSNLRLKWDALIRDTDADPELPGAATFFGPQEGIDGGIWQANFGPPVVPFGCQGTECTLRWPSVTKHDPDTGQIIFGTRRWLGQCQTTEGCIGLDPGTPDPAVGASSMTVDVDGNVYVGDADQFWSFDKDGNLNWVVDYLDVKPETDINGIFLSAIITKEGFVGNVTTDGFLVLLNRDDGSPAVPALEIPMGPGHFGECPDTDIFFQGGELFEPAINCLVCGLEGIGPPNTNTPAVSPETGRIFFVHQDADEHDLDSVTAIDIVPGGPLGHQAQIAWTTQLMGGQSGASVAITADHKKVLATPSTTGQMQGIDTETGEVLWISPQVALAVAPPGLHRNGIAYIATGQTLLAIDTRDGSTLFERDYTAVARMFLPVKEPTVDPLLVPDGNPYSEVTITVTTSLNKVWINLKLGYRMALLDDEVIPHTNAIFPVDPETGDVIGQPTEYNGTNEGLTDILTDGSTYISRGEVLAEVFFYVFNAILPPRFDAPNVPIAGIGAFEPASFLDFAIEGVEAVQGLNAEALDALSPNVPDLQAAFNVVRWGRGQVGFTKSTIDDAVERGELDQQRAQRAKARLDAAEAALTVAREILVQDQPSKQELAKAMGSIRKANGQLNSAKQMLRSG